jgi:hypothetical protein
MSQAIPDNKNISEKKDYLDALNNYYKLKETYENNFNKEKTNIKNNNNLSWKERRMEYKSYKPKCVNCKRPVGTIFSRIYDEKEFSHVLKAICGDIQDPCSLNITLNIGYFDTIPNIVKKDEKDMEDLKILLIKDKNNLLFGYISTEVALENFDNLKKEIVDISASLETLTEKWMNLNDDTKIKDALNKKQEEGYIVINSIKKLIDDYSHNNNPSLIYDAVTIYVNQLTPILKQVMDLKYDINQVEFMEDENVYRLIQKKNSMYNLEYNYGKEEIISYNIGFTSKRSSTNDIEEDIM